MYATQLQSPLVQPYQYPAPIAPAPAPAPAQTGGIDIGGLLQTIMPLMSMALVFALIMPMFKDMTGAFNKKE